MIAPPIHPEPPVLRDLGRDLTHVSVVRRTWTLALPFIWILLYVVFGLLTWWPLAVACLVCLSFVTYGSISHDLVHANLGLRRGINDLFLSLIELLCLRSGHAYRLAHLHHHARFPHDDDIEGAAAGMSFARALWEGVFFQPKIWLWAVRRASRDRVWIIVEGGGVALLITIAILLAPVTPLPIVYVGLMIAGSWIIPVVTSYVPHNPTGDGELFQTRRYRGRIASLISLEHLYHLEHHLYPAVPHHHWPELARRLDPYFDEAGVKAIKFWV